MEDTRNDWELNPNGTHAVFIDLKKAFNTVSHDTLLQKPENCELRAPIQALLKSYLKNRSQVVKIGSKMSKLKSIHCGFPHGSVLGPVLFILMIIDFPTVTNSVNTYLYADNTAVKLKEQNLHQYSEDLSKIGNWMKINKLTQNLDTTINISFKRKIVIGIDKIEVGIVDVKKCLYNIRLGIHMDLELDFKFLINFFFSKNE